jgi:hypothetical protein
MNHWLIMALSVSTGCKPRGVALANRIGGGGIARLEEETWLF